VTQIRHGALRKSALGPFQLPFIPVEPLKDQVKVFQVLLITGTVYKYIVEENNDKFTKTGGGAKVTFIVP
jgi:hypothetical protein